MNLKVNLTTVFLGIIMALFLSCEKDKVEISKNEDLFYPDGFNGIAILFNNDTIYQIPNGYALYVTTCEILFINNTNMRYYVTNHYMSEIIKSKVIIIPSDTTVHNMGFLNGLLIKNDIEIFNWYTDSPYIVPDRKTLYLTSFNEFGLSIDDTELHPWEDSHLEVFSPLILPSGTKISHKQKYIFTGYLKDN